MRTNSQFYRYLANPSVAQTIYISVCVLLYSFFHDFFTSSFIQSNYYNGFLFILPISLLGARLTYKDTPASFKILLRSVVAIALFYVATSHTSMPDEILTPGETTRFGVNAGWVVAIICGLIALIRPSFGLVPLQYITWQKFLLSRIYDLPLTHTDYITLADSGSFLIFGILLLGVIRWSNLYVKKANFYGLVNLKGDEGLHPLELLILSGVALHFGNYYYGALFKISLGDHLLFWALENRTYILITMALENAVMPLSFNAALTESIFERFSHIYVLFNFLTLFAQIICIAAIVRVRWTILITVFYDLMHISIFLLTGIFFWKWVLLNFSIVIALSRFRNKIVPRAQKILLVFLVALSPSIFHIPMFGWLDTPAVNTVNLYAITGDGREFRVPANYMLGLSVTFQQQRVVWPNEGAFNTLTWGTTHSADEMHSSMTCSNEPNSGENPIHYFVSKDKITKSTQKHHQLVLSLIDNQGQFEYDLFPHHIFSVPWQFREFRKLDKRLIVAYRYESNSVCVKYEKGEISKDSKHSASFIIPINRKK